jgi:hypothetical protein
MYGRQLSGLSVGIVWATFSAGRQLIDEKQKSR